MKEHVKKHFIAFITFIIGVTIGTGGFWHYQQLEFEKTKLAYEIKKDIYKFQNEIVAKYQEVGKISSAVYKLLPEESKNWDRLQELYNEKRETQQEIHHLTKEINNREEQLASLEGRKARGMDFVPPAAPSLKITIK